MADTNNGGERIDYLDPRSVLHSTPPARPAHAHAYQVGAPSVDCRTCLGVGIVGVDRGPSHPGDSATCPDCDGTGTSLDDERIAEILAAAVKAEDVELVVECEAALAPIQREYTRRAHVARVAELVNARTRGEAA